MAISAQTKLNAWNYAVQNVSLEHIVYAMMLGNGENIIPLWVFCEDIILDASSVYPGDKFVARHNGVTSANATQTLFIIAPMRHNDELC